MNELDNKKVKLKVSLTGIEIEALGYNSEDVSKLSKRLVFIASLLFLVVILIVKYLK